MALVDEEGKPLVGAVGHKDEETGYSLERCKIILAAGASISAIYATIVMVSATNQTR